MSAATRTALALALLVPLLCSTRSAGAQPRWDPDQYRLLVDQATAAWQQYRDGGDPDALATAVRAWQDALGMLEEAIRRHQTAGYQADAEQQRHQLGANLVGGLYYTRACDAAQDRARRMEAERDLDEQTRSLLRRFDGRITVCLSETEGDRQWSAWTESAQPDALQAATEAWRQALDDLEVALRDDDSAGWADEGAAIRARLAEKLIGAELARPDCQEAQRWLTWLNERLAPGTANEDDATLADLEARVRTCGQPASSPPPEVVPAPQPPASAEARPPLAGYVLLGLSGALAVAVIAVDVSQADNRSRFDDLRGRCESGQLCDLDTLRGLASDIDSARTVMWVLAGLGLASAGVGVTLLLVDGHEPAARVSVAPVGRGQGMALTLGGLF